MLLFSRFLLLLAATVANSLTTFAVAFSNISPIPSWDQLSATPALSKPTPPPIYHDTLPAELSNDNASIKEKPILYRDKDCIDAASQSVWLALECKNVDYITVLVSMADNDDDAANIPRITWPENVDDDEDTTTSSNEITSDPIKLLEQIQKHYPNSSPPQFYPKVSAAVDASRCNIIRLPGVMPRNSDCNFMSRAPYLFKEDGTKVLKSSHCVSLEEVDEMQEEYYLGDYLCGRDVAAADMIWAPYLERYAIQLPLIFPNIMKCNPRSRVYKEVAAWYKIMETTLPAYSCCVQGDARHWRRCLEDVIGIHNARAVSDDEMVKSLPPIPKEVGWWMNKNPNANELWKEYATESHRTWLGDTPSIEVALYLLRNHVDIVTAAVESLDNMLEENADEGLRELIQLLIADDDDDSDETISLEELSESARQIATFASETIEIPKDMSMIPALALGELVEQITLIETQHVVSSIV